MHGRGRDDLPPGREPTPIAIVIDPNTSANRKPTTRPISSGGVRSWNSVWLGMMKTMFATPGPNVSPSAIGRLPVSASRNDEHAPDRVAGDDHPALREARPDEPDHEAADQVADAEPGLEEAVGRLSPIRRCRRRSTCVGSASAR